MYEIQIQSFIIPALASLFFLCCIAKFLSKHGGNKKPPPSPPRLPILGNLHQLRSLPHLNLQSLAKQHGPLMLLHFGSAPVLIVSSADAAREIIRNHDASFSDRPLNKVMKKVVHGGKDVAFAPYGDSWRQGRGFFVLKFLSQKRVRSFRSIREEETAAFVRKVRETAGPVNLAEMFFEFANHVVCRSAFGRKYSESGKVKKFLKLVEELAELMGSVCVGDFVPWLSWVDRVSGFDGKLERVAGGLDEFIEGVIEERLQTQVQALDGDNFLDIMLQMYKDETAHASIDTDVIKSVILDVFAAGTDTSAVVLEWVMTELLARPTVMQKLQHEVREIVRQNSSIITEDDLEKMHYLKAVIKETLRIRPPLPLLLPRKAREDVIINGYNVSAGTMVLTNYWAIGRDPVCWDKPEKFKPSRFLNSTVDFRGLDFELIPFGGGRRGCPGITYSVAAIEFLLANLVHEFNWKLPDDEQLDMSVKPGITLHKADPLFAVATKAM